MGYSSHPSTCQALCRTETDAADRQVCAVPAAIWGVGNVEQVAVKSYLQEDTLSLPFWA